MCCDIEGHLWQAYWEGNRIERICKNTGKIMHVINFPGAPRITSCCFGGEDMMTLYVTTAARGLDPASSDDLAQAGSLFKIKTDF